MTIAVAFQDVTLLDQQRWKLSMRGSRRVAGLDDQQRPWRTEHRTDLNKWVYFGTTDDADVTLPVYGPQAAIGRLLVVRRRVLVLDYDDRISIHVGSCTIEMGGQLFELHVDPKGSVAADPEALLNRFMKFIKSEFYHRLELALIQPQEGRRGVWDGKALFTSEGVPSEELLVALQQSICIKEDCDSSILGEALDAALDYLYSTIHGFGLLAPLIAAPGVKEVLVNSCSEIYVEDADGMHLSEAVFPGPDVLGRLIESLLARMDSRIDSSQPVAQGVLGGRYRVHIISAQICPGGPSLSIRCFPERTFELADLMGRRGKKVHLRELLDAIVKDRRNILICGETSSGKTSLIEALSAHIPDCERVIVAEDVRELRLANRHKVYLQTQQGFASSVAEVDLRGLVKESLRMRPDRLVIGECRGAEALDLLQALNTGHDGSMTSIHGACAMSALRRLETLSMFGNSKVTRSTAAALIASGVHVVIEMHRKNNGTRYVRSVSRVVPTNSTASSAAEYGLEVLFSEEHL
jgi:pilus assembly protein CpaF